MSTGSSRLVPFVVISAAVHALVFVAAGPESLTINTAPAGKGHEVSIRLEAAAPSGAAASSAERPREIPEEESISQSRPPEPETEPTKIAQLETASEPAEEPDAEPDERSEPDEPEQSTETESRDEPIETVEPIEDVVEEADESQPPEEVADVDEAARGDASTSSEAQRVEVREAIATELAKHFRYPRLAQRRGWEGTVVLTVRILSDGRLDEIRVKRSSGRSLLDRSARQALAGVERLPQFENRVGEDGLALEIPVTYRLESA